MLVFVFVVAQYNLDMVIGLINDAEDRYRNFQHPMPTFVGSVAFLGLSVPALVPLFALNVSYQII